MPLPPGTRRRLVFLALPSGNPSAFVDGAPSWESDWLEEVFPWRPVWTPLSDAPPVRTELPILMLAAPSSDAALDTIREFQAANRPFGILHLSDEWYRDPTWVTGLSCCRFVIRNYVPPPGTAGSAPAITIPLGYKRGMWRDIEDDVRSSLAANEGRSYLWSFAGDPHKINRFEMLEAFAPLGPNRVHLIEYWDAPDSLSTEDYRDMLLDSDFVLCPAGNWNVETFRIWEALECGAIPVIVDAAQDRVESYFRRLAGADHPLPLFSSLEKAREWVSRMAHERHIAVPRVRHRLLTWWRLRKHLIRLALNDLQPLPAAATPRASTITVKHERRPRFSTTGLKIPEPRRHPR